MRQYIVNAFTNKPFEGNPAAVCILDREIEEEQMMQISMQNNLSETAFVYLDGEQFHLRWFTPTQEVGLCGHATLAAAYVMLNHYLTRSPSVTFSTQGGDIVVRRYAQLLEMTFPAISMEQIAVTEEMQTAIGIKPLEAWLGLDLVLVLESVQDVLECTVDPVLAIELPGRMVHVTAQDKSYTCRSRSFGPKIGIIENPVCGSAHCQIAPLWHDKLNRSLITARQESARGGSLMCTVEEDQVKIAGEAYLYSIAELKIEPEYIRHYYESEEDDEEQPSLSE